MSLQIIIAGALGVASFATLGITAKLGQAMPAAPITGTFISGAFAIAALVLALKHTGNGDIHLTARDNFPDQKTCDTRHDAIKQNQDRLSQSQDRLHKDMRKLKDANYAMISRLFNLPLKPRKHRASADSGSMTQIAKAITEDLNGGDEDEVANEDQNT